MFQDRNCKTEHMVETIQKKAQILKRSEKNIHREKYVQKLHTYALFDPSVFLLLTIRVKRKKKKNMW